MHQVFGDSFFVSTRCAPKLTECILVVKTGSVIDALWPPSCAPKTKITKKKYDMILIKFDHATSIVAVTVLFTRFIVGQDREMIDILK